MGGERSHVSLLGERMSQGCGYWLGKEEGRLYTSYGYYCLSFNSLMLLTQRGRSECKAWIDKVSGAKKSEWGWFTVCYGICQHPVDFVLLLLQMH